MSSGEKSVHWADSKMSANFFRVDSKVKLDFNSEKELRRNSGLNILNKLLHKGLNDFTRFTSLNRTDGVEKFH